jgi:hypothetical protein
MEYRATTQKALFFKARYCAIKIEKYFIADEVELMEVTDNFTYE